MCFLIKVVIHHALEDHLPERAQERKNVAEYYKEYLGSPFLREDQTSYVTPLLEGILIWNWTVTMLI
jgi:hypothetical protein